MRKLERILLITSVLMAVINLFGFPGTTLFMTISYCSLAFIYMFISVISLGKLGIGLIVTKPLVVEYASDNSIFPSIKAPNNSVFNPVGWKQKVALFLVCYCLSVMALAILFRMSYWAGSSLMLTFGIAQSVIILIPVIIKQLSKPSLFYKQMLIRLSIFSIICVLLLMLPANFFIDIKYRNNPKMLQERSGHDPNQ
ncbi:hypothetical protein F0919_02725 [Taibaiella lutea]|uniref:Uncharacterized protein n=1 Tax=Taibaiella lutea TaxID=2608001 RepID=A0A5M6CRN2_9BACT|nr:hypothetical protein [Taibaiella lutea]KAA5536602.1 hypothetical protein F0919_02725 [Taibaiella lutea]